MWSFHSLAVSGDAFLLKADYGNVLVDGGCGTDKLVRQLKAIGSPHIKVVICTHNDIDHAGGLRKFADKWPQIDEFWLPGSWASVVDEILLKPDVIRERLAEEIFITHANFLEGLWLDSMEQTKVYDAPPFDEQQMATIYESIIDEHAQKPIGSPINERGPLQPSDGVATLSEESDWMRNLRQEATPMVQIPKNPYPSHFPSLGPFQKRIHRPGLLSIYLKMISAAANIYEISASAIRNKKPIRWFDFSLFQQSGRPSGGLPGRLEPVNAVELRVQPKRVGSLIYFLSLTRTNRESLVFYSNERLKMPGVLFSGDSPLNFRVARHAAKFPMKFLPPNRDLVITAPHHASKSNVVAYRVIKSWAGIDRHIWFKNGGRVGNVRACKTFLRRNLRVCSQCWHSQPLIHPATMGVGTTTTGLDWDITTLVGHQCVC